MHGIEGLEAATYFICLGSLLNTKVLSSFIHSGSIRFQIITYALIKHLFYFKALSWAARKQKQDHFPASDGTRSIGKTGYTQAGVTGAVTVCVHGSCAR
jgi:membrane protein implicated in regulation of membrane protease activity